jgi:hypothetical protein
MDIGSILLILGLLILVIMFISRPLVEGKAVAITAEEHELSALLADRDRILTTLQEMEFDYLLGKIPEEDYPVQRAAYMQRGAEVLRKIDEYQAAGQVVPAEDRLEAAIAARRQAQAPQQAAPQPGAPRSNGDSVPIPDDELEQAIASRRRTRPEKAGGFCPKCGGPVQQSDRFCPKCGASLA